MKLKIGQAVSEAIVVEGSRVDRFAEASGDNNPIHLDDDAARAVGFPGRIAHGMLAAALVSRILGTRLPGAGTIFLGQTLRFGVPVLVGDTLTVSVEVKAIRSDKPIVTLETTCRNQRGEVVLNGEAVVKVPPDGS